MICRAKVSEFPHPEFARDDVPPKRRFQQSLRRPSWVDVRAGGILSLLRFCSCLGCGLLRGGRKHGKCCWQAMTTLSRMINETDKRDRAIGLAHLYKFKKSILLHLFSAGTPVCMCKACCRWHTIQSGTCTRSSSRHKHAKIRVCMHWILSLLEPMASTKSPSPIPG
jgi:hypothetical protein